MSLPGCAAIPAPYRERGQMAYETGRRIVGMVHENLRPSDIMTKAAFENAVRAAAALGASSNCPIHMVAIARHMGVEHSLDDWQRLGPDVPLLVDCQPAGRFLGEMFHRGGGVPAVLRELLGAGKLDGSAMTVTGKTIGENIAGLPDADRQVIRAYAKPMLERAGYVVMTGNLFDNAVMKMSVIDQEFRTRYLSHPDRPNVFEGKAIVFEGPEDYHERINDPSLNIDASCVLVIRGVGPVGYPGAAEVVNMLPPDALVQAGVNQLPCIGDGRQSGTSASPSILNASPESAVGGNLAILETGDKLKVDLNARRVDIMISDEEITRRRAQLKIAMPASQTPWQELFRTHVGQLSTGGCLEFAVNYHNVGGDLPRHNH